MLLEFISVRAQFAARDLSQISVAGKASESCGRALRWNSVNHVTHQINGRQSDFLKLYCMTVNYLLN